MLITTKQRLKEVFGGTYADAARAIGVTRQCINGWPSTLTQRQSDWATGAAVRVGRLIAEQGDNGVSQDEQMETASLAGDDVPRRRSDCVTSTGVGNKATGQHGAVPANGGSSSFGDYSTQPQEAVTVSVNF